MIRLVYAWVSSDELSAEAVLFMFSQFNIFQLPSIEIDADAVLSGAGSERLPCVIVWEIVSRFDHGGH